MTEVKAVRNNSATYKVARALWYAKPHKAELRAESIELSSNNDALVRTMFSGISRGTERLIFRGEVPESEFESMRAPMQIGEFPFPVKYGYCATGIVEEGPKELKGNTFFCLHPHQDLFRVAPELLVPIPPSVPAKRATLAANMETALNAHWDAASSPCDRIAVVGAGVVGLLIAHLAARLPGTDVIVIDSNPARREIAVAFGAQFASPEQAPEDCDIVFSASASAAGLATALSCGGFEARIVEVSWHGAKLVSIPLGGPFHSRRLSIISSQVGHVAARRRPRWDYSRRISAAMKLLDRPELDLLVNEEIAFDDAPERLPLILSPESAALAPVIRYT